MENVIGIGPLILKIIITGSIGWLFVVLLRALGRRELAAFMKIITIFLCIIPLMDLVAVIVKDIKEFIDTLNDIVEPIKNILEFIQKSIGSDT